MATLYGASLEVLTSIVGPIPAKMCLSAACVEIGRTAETLLDTDFDAVAEKIRRDMGRFASPELIENALKQIQSKM